MFEYLSAINHGQNPEKIQFKKYGKKNSAKKVYAYYLPQFHPFLENDLYWGKGFTEWRNVTKALPLFEGHLQPRHPADLGFYDLRLPESIDMQAKMAKNYHIDGFSIYYYWFDGKKIMNTPIDIIYNHKEIDIEYCIFWANENWTRSWDGSDNLIIIKQNHSDEDDIKFIAEAAKYFEDDRYIKFNGNPVLKVYRPSLFPNPQKTCDAWKNWCSKNGISVPYLIMSQAFQEPNLGRELNPQFYGFDASVEFPPHRGSTFNPDKIKVVGNTKPMFGSKLNTVIDYGSAVEAWSLINTDNFKQFKCVFPSWDNSPRRINGGATIYANSNPELYYSWLRFALENTARNEFMFINAWNEWAEGAMLEPDFFWGTAYLDATRRAIEDDYLFNFQGGVK
jgi:hypothetical protein